MSPACTSSGVVVHRRADHADAHAVDAEHRRRSSSSPASLPVASSTMFADRNGKSARAWCGRMRSIAEVELVVAEARGVEPPRVLDVDRRHVLAAAPSSAATRRRCRPPPAAASGPGSAAASSSNIVASCAAPPTRHGRVPSIVVVVGSSWPWKSFSPMIDDRRVVVAVVEDVAPHDALAVLRRRDAEQERRRRREVDAAHVVDHAALDRRAAGEERRAHVRVGCRGPARPARSRAGRRTPSARSACRASPRRTGTAGRRTTTRSPVRVGCAMSAVLSGAVRDVARLGLGEDAVDDLPALGLAVAGPVVGVLERRGTRP